MKIFKAACAALALLAAGASNAETVDGSGFLWDWRRLNAGAGSVWLRNDGCLSLFNVVSGADNMSNSDMVLSCGPDTPAKYGAGVWDKAVCEFPEGPLPRTLQIRGTLSNGYALLERIVFDKSSIELSFDFEATRDDLPAPAVSGSLGSVSETGGPVSCYGFLADGSKGSFKGKLTEIVEKPFSFDRWLEVAPLGGDRLLRVVLERPCAMEIADAKTRASSGYSYSLASWKTTPAGKTVFAKGEKASLKFKISLVPCGAGFSTPSSKPLLASVDKPWDEALPPCEAPAERIGLEPEGRAVPVWSFGETPRLKVLSKEASRIRVEAKDAYDNSPAGSFALELKNGSASFEFKPPKPSVYLLSMNEEGSKLPPVERELAVAGRVEQPEATCEEMEKALKKRLVDQVDLSLPADAAHPRYALHGGDKIERKPFGSYWESAPLKSLSDGTFICSEVRVEKPGVPHIVEIDYPDDADRNMGFSAGEVFNEKEPVRQLGKKSEGGVATGRPATPSGTMKTWSVVVLPVGRRLFISAQPDKPGWTAAMARIRVYELESPLPALKAFEPEGDGAKRELGQHWERLDICFGVFNPDNVFEDRIRNKFDQRRFYSAAFKSFENLIRYMRFRGDNSLQAGIFMYKRWRMLPGEEGVWSRNDAWELLGRMFAANKLSLRFSDETLADSSMFGFGQFTDKQVAEGAQTLMPVAFDGRQSALCWAGAFINPLTPQGQTALKRHYAKIAARYAATPGVKGVANVAFNTLFGIYGDKSLGPDLFLRFSYDDFTCALFERRTGLVIPADAKDPQRFKKRFEWIRANAKREWIAFLDKEMLDLNRQIGQEIKRLAPSWSYEVVSPALGMAMESQAAVKKQNEIERLIAQTGCDPALWKDDPWASLCLMQPMSDDAKPSVYREDPERSALIAEKLSDPAFLRWIAPSAKATVWTGGTFYESYCKDVPSDWPFTRFDCVNYTEPAEPFDLRDFAFAMAHCDPARIVYIWCDCRPFMGNELRKQRFSAALRALPAVHFESPKRETRWLQGLFGSGETPEPAVVLRRAVWKGESYFYLVNASARPLKTKTATGSESVVDLLSGKTTATPGGALELELQPFETRPFKGAGEKPELAD